MNGTKEKFLEELDLSIKRHYSRYQQLTAVQWIVMILVAVAGVFTTVAGSPQGANQWFAQSNFLVAWGGIAAIGAAINQFGNPGKSGENHLKQKLALKAIRGAIEFRNLPLDQAEQLRVISRTNPEEAVEKLNQWHGNQPA